METTAVVNTSEDTAGRGVSRRTVMKGAAWSMPVLAVAAAAPIAAASCFRGDSSQYNVSMIIDASTDFPNANPGGIPHYDVSLGAHITATNTYTNTGDLAWPVGTVIIVEVSNNYRDISASIVSTSGYTSALGTPVYIEEPGNPAGGSNGTRFVYTTVAETPVGESVTINWEFWATTTNPWNGFYSLGRLRIPNCAGTGSVLNRLAALGSTNGTPAWYYVVRS